MDIDQGEECLSRWFLALFRCVVSGLLSGEKEEGIMDKQVFKLKALVLLLVACFAFSPRAQAESPARVYRGWSTAVGDLALQSLTSGLWNTAIGGNALSRETTGGCNTAVGKDALCSNTTGGSNAAYGVNALKSNITGSRNTALGDSAGIFLTKGDRNIFIGNGAGINLTAGDQNIYIAHIGVASESDTIRIGDWRQSRIFISGIRGVTTGSGDAAPVVIDSAGQLGTLSSSRRFKKEIKPIDKASETILALKPVTFRYKSDNTGTPQFGLIAEEVAAVNPDLVMRDENGEIYTVRYDAVNAMLLNEFLKEHRKVEALQASFAQQQKDFQATAAQQRKEFESKIAQQQKQIEALTAGLQKVNAQVQTNRPAPQLADNKQ
jgi:endosialidase-like protein